MKRPPNCFTVAELCVELDTSANTLQRWRTHGTGPKWIRQGMRKIFYPKATVSEWLRPAPMQSTSESMAAKYDPSVTRHKTR